MPKKIERPNVESEEAKKHFDELTAHNANKKITRELDEISDSIPEEVFDDLARERKDATILLHSDKEINEAIDKITRTDTTKQELRQWEMERARRQHEGGRGVERTKK